MISTCIPRKKSVLLKSTRNHVVTSFITDEFVGTTVAVMLVVNRYRATSAYNPENEGQARVAVCSNLALSLVRFSVECPRRILKAAHGTSIVA